MFTGIISGVGAIKKIVHRAHMRTLWVKLPTISPKKGSSVALNGVCLTVTEKHGLLASFDLVSETLQNTNLGRLKQGDRVNVELSLRMGDRVDGHFVSGHIDGCGRVKKIDSKNLYVEIPKKLTIFTARKGWIMLDGVALTIAKRTHSLIVVALIPFTLRHTTLGSRKKGDLVNIEVDPIARYVNALIK